MSTAPLRMGQREWALLGLLSILWGGTFVFVEVALRDLPPLTLVLTRVLIAAMALRAWVFVAGVRPPPGRRVWPSFLVLGALNNLIPFSLIFWGQTRMTAGLAAILNATTPLWAVLLAHLLTRDERLSPAKLLGVMIGLGGAVLVIGPANLRLWGDTGLPPLAVLVASCSYALAGIFGRRLRGVPPLVIAAGQLTCGTLLVAPVALLVDQPWQLPPPSSSTLLAVFGLALLSTALAYTFYFRILAAAGATNVVLVTFLIPVSTVLLAAAFLGEVVDPGEIGGMALIGLGLAVIDGRLIARLRRAVSEIARRG